MRNSHFKKTPWFDEMQRFPFPRMPLEQKEFHRVSSGKGRCEIFLKCFLPGKKSTFKVTKLTLKYRLSFGLSDPQSSYLPKYKFSPPSVAGWATGSSFWFIALPSF